MPSETDPPASNGDALAGLVAKFEREELARRIAVGNVDRSLQEASDVNAKKAEMRQFKNAGLSDGAATFAANLKFAKVEPVVFPKPPGGNAA